MILDDKQEAVVTIDADKRMGLKVVMTNGCFDILHTGHIANLRASQALGNVLVVAVNSDESVARLKGDSRPIVPLVDRMAVLDALEMVDYVISFDDDTPNDVICLLEPDILTKGGDYEVEQIAGHKCVQEAGGRVVIIPIVEGQSTTSIMERVVKSNDIELEPEDEYEAKLVTNRGIVPVSATVDMFLCEIDPLDIVEAYARRVGDEHWYEIVPETTNLLNPARLGDHIRYIKGSLK